MNFIKYYYHIYLTKSYPHNIFLEILFENGLIGIILFLVLFFLNILFSADLTSNNQLFLVITIFNNISRNKKNNLNK